MSEPSDVDPTRRQRTPAPPNPLADPASPATDLETRPSLARRGILAIIDHPLIVAFVATLGVLGALLLGSALGSIATILIYIILALFIALGLDPVVRRLERAGMKRGAGIATVFAAFAVLVALFLIFVLPPVLAQIVEFVAPSRRR